MDSSHDRNDMLPSVDDMDSHPVHDVDSITKTDDTSQRPPSYAYLSAPSERPLRASSPTPSLLSILSADELQELYPRRASPSLGWTAHAKQQPEHPPRTRFQTFWLKYEGVTWALLAQAFGSMMNLATQLLETEGNHGKGLEAFEILFVRMGITVVFSVAYMWYRQTPHFPFGAKEVRLLLVFRAVGGFMGVFGMYYSLKYLPVQLAVVVTFLAPFLANFVCSKIYGEPFTRTDKITGLVSLVGVILLAHPETLLAMAMGEKVEDADIPPASGTGDMAPGNSGETGVQYSTPAQQASAVAVAMIGVVGATIAYTTIRVIGKRAHPLISVNYFATSSFIISAIALAIKRNVTLPSDPRDWGLLIFLGTCGFTMQFLLAKALGHARDAKATNMQYSQMIFAMLGDKLMFGYTPDLTALMGSGLIVGSVIVMLLQKAPAQKADNAAEAEAESRVGLLAETDLESGEDHDRVQPQDIQMRDLR